jgi:hypothetical protein
LRKVFNLAEVQLTEPEWLACDWPFDMLRHLDGKLDDQAFMRFSVLCCRRIWPLLSDSRSRAVVEATGAYLAGQLTAEAAALILEEWDRAYQAGEVNDLAGGSTNEAIESVCGVGFGHAAQVAKACFESAGYAASASVREAGAPQPEITAAWLAAESAERLAQCQLLRQLFGYRPESATKEAEPVAAPDRPRE